ncbi:MAG: iron-containing alcohol dehydrogenase, partial [Schwartzia sp.]|nr:iron-containing alcohol dehydrogenase [Schwartzia sp. (in: firmicutes)]
MNNFTYCVPTEIIFGRDAERQTAAAVKRHGGRRVLLVFGGGSAKKSGLLDTIEKQLTMEEIRFEEFGGA